MRILALFALLASGCASMREARAQHDAQIAQDERYQQAWVQQEMTFDANCAQPPDQAWRDWCTERARQAQQAQWARENEQRERLIQAQQPAHQNCTSTLVGKSVFTNCY